MHFFLEEGGEYREGLKLLLAEQGHSLLACGRGQEEEKGILILPEEAKEEKLSVTFLPGKAENTGRKEACAEGVKGPEGRETGGCGESGPQLEMEGILRVRFCRKAHFFRGVMKFLRDWEKCGGTGMAGRYAFTEKVWFTENGAMFDCSRNGVLNEEKVKEEIRRLAGLGMNTLYLYTEDTYELPDYPYFGAFRGRYTVRELKALDAYAALFGVEMIPCIQTLAHLHTALRWSVHAHLKDTEDILLAESEETYRLIRQMIRTVADCFHSRKIHLGMDEAHELGLGRYLTLHGYQDRFAVMSRHLERVCAICREEGLAPRIWSDMYFRLNSPSGDYYDLPADSDLSGSPRPPAEVSLVYWDYYHEEQGHYKSYFRLHKSLLERELPEGQCKGGLIFAGGAWTWNGVAPNYSKMAAVSDSALRACRENGVRDVICTLWQDNGAETPMEAGAPALVFFAEYGFAEEPSRQEMDDWLTFFWGREGKDWAMLDRFDRIPGITDGGPDGHVREDNPSKFLLYQDVLTGLFDGQIRGLGLGEHYSALARDLSDCLKQENGQSRETAQLFACYDTLARLLACKAELGIRLYDAYRGKDRTTLRELTEYTLPDCIRLSEELLECRRRLWFAECRPNGFEVLDIRLSGVTARLRSAKARVEDYLEGRAGLLPELEEPRPVYAPDWKDPAHKLCSCNLWQNIISAGNIAGI